MKSFLAGKSTLNQIELALLGNISNTKILHLQCHFGQDTLSWSRLGAKCVGVDLSDAGPFSVRPYDFIDNGKLSLLTVPSTETYLFYLEIFIGTLVPIFLLSYKKLIEDIKVNCYLNCKM